MATEVTIGGEGKLFIGEDKTIRLEVTTPSWATTPYVPIDMTGWAVLFDVRTKDSAPDAIISQAAVIGGVYSSTRASNTQRAVVVLTDTQMNLLRVKTYRHSWKRMDDGSETVLCRGDFPPEKATAP